MATPERSIRLRPADRKALGPKPCPSRKADVAAKEQKISGKNSRLRQIDKEEPDPIFPRTKSVPEYDELHHSGSHMNRAQKQLPFYFPQVTKIKPRQNHVNFFLY